MKESKLMGLFDGYLSACDSNCISQMVQPGGPTQVMDDPPVFAKCRS